VADELQALGERLYELFVEVAGDRVRVVASVKRKHVVEFTAPAFGDEVLAAAVGVLVQLGCNLRALLPFLVSVRELADQECCSLRHCGR
jgi:hypothetical protein